MKKLLPFLLFALTITASAADRPGLDALKAAKIATDYLKTLGSDAPYIASIVLDKGAILNGQPSWVVTWSQTITNDGSTEVGLRVKGDGSIARLVEGKGSRSKRQPAALELR